MSDLGQTEASEEERALLGGLGAWLKANGEGVYGSRPWKLTAEGPTQSRTGSFADSQEIDYTPQDIRFTTKSGCIYAFLLRYPENGCVCIRSLARKDAAGIDDFGGILADVKLLGFEESPVWLRDGDGLHLRTRTVRSELPVTVKMILE